MLVAPQVDSSCQKCRLRNIVERGPIGSLNLGDNVHQDTVSPNSSIFQNGRPSTTAKRPDGESRPAWNCRSERKKDLTNRHRISLSLVCYLGLYSLWPIMNNAIQVSKKKRKNDNNNHVQWPFLFTLAIFSSLSFGFFFSTVWWSSRSSSDI